MKSKLIAVFACAVLASAAMPSLADDSHHPKAAAAKSYAVGGEVVAVDKAGSRLQLKHSAVPELKWPAMTMYFAVADQAQLDAVKPGDRVDVSFVLQQGSAPLINSIAPVK